MAKAYYHNLITKSILDLVFEEKAARNREIYNLHTKEKWTYTSIARKYRLSRQRVQQICESVQKKKFFSMKGGVNKSR